MATTYERRDRPYGIDMTIKDSTSCPRLLAREYRWNKRLTKWDSLPCLRLMPNKCIFECGRCHFMNTIGPTCPWCLGACDKMVDTNAVIGARPRRISAPQLLSNAQKAQLERIEKRTAERKYSVKPTTFRVPGAASHGDVLFDNSGVLTRRREPTSTKTVLRASNRKAAIYSVGDVVASVTTDVELKPFLRHLVDMLEQGEQARSSPPSTPPQSIVATPSIPLDACLPGAEPERIVHASEEERPGSIDVGSHLAPSVLSQRTLRRKQRMGVLRQRSSCSLRKRSTPSLSKASSRRIESAVASVARPSTPTSQAFTPLIPLGHPQRPLYTAIRKNMPRPPIPDYLIPKADMNALHGQMFDRGTKSLDVPRAATLGRSYGHRAVIPPTEWTMGCSLSGETELRMSLDRCRSADSVTSDFKFRETRKGGAVRDKVKSLGKGLRGLLLGRA